MSKKKNQIIEITILAAVLLIAVFSYLFVGRGMKQSADIDINISSEASVITQALDTTAANDTPADELEPETTPEPKPEPEPKLAPKPTFHPTPEPTEAPAGNNVLEYTSPSSGNKTETESKPQTKASDSNSSGENLAALRKKYGNNDITGYLEIEGTNIAYPVTQTSNNEYYLDHDIYGGKSSAGAVFMDYDSSVDPFGYNTVIYGHNMKNGTMFHNLRYYLDESYFQEHPLIKFTTQTEETVWEIFSCYQTTTDFTYIQTNFKNNLMFYALLLTMKQKSFYDTGVTIDKDDRLMTLSTCANEGGENRYVVNAKLRK